DVPGPGRRYRHRHPDHRDLRTRGQDRGLHRADAALRHSRTGADGADRSGPWPAENDRRRVVSTSPTLPSSTRPVRPELASLVRSLKPGQRIRIKQTVRMNSRWGWSTTVEGTFREVNYLATGLATDRVPEDDIVVVTVHFTKDNGELSSVTLDGHSEIEV